MDEYQIHRLLGSIGCSKIKTRSNGWVEASCPFALWKHAKGTDRSPSFAVSIVPKGTSRYRCHSCGSHGEMLQFLWRLESLSGRSYRNLHAFVSQSNSPSLADLDRRLALAASGEKPKAKVAGIDVSLSMFDGEEPKLEILPDTVLDMFEDPSGEVLEYLTTDKIFVHGMKRYKGRNFKPEDIVAWELGWHAIQKRISIPMRDCDGNLVGISGRAWPLHREPKYLHPKGFRRDLFLYGEHRIVKGKPAKLVEGQFDVENLVNFGYENVLGVLGSYVSKFHIKKLKEWFPSVAIIPDGDKAGRDGARVSAQMIEKRLPVTIFEVPDDLDPGDYTLEQATEILGPP